MTEHTPQFIQFQLQFTKLCECGCGNPAPIAKVTRTERGQVRGQPIRFISGHNGYNHGSLADAFWKHVAPGTAENCWDWVGATTGFGYGSLRYHRKGYVGHRVSYEIHYGPIPDGLGVLHKCDRPRCVNPNHLWLGTDADNHRDMVNKGRQACGEQHPNSKLTEAVVLKIRRLFRQGIRQIDIAHQLAIPTSRVQAIVRYREWKHIP